MLLTITLSASDIAAPFLTESGFCLPAGLGTGAGPGAGLAELDPGRGKPGTSSGLGTGAGPGAGLAELDPGCGKPGTSSGLGTGAGPGAGSAEPDPGRGKPGTSSGELDLGAGELGACDGGSIGGRFRTSSMTLFPKKTV